MDQTSMFPAVRREYPVGELIRRIEQLEAEVEKLRRQVALLTIQLEESAMRSM